MGDKIIGEIKFYDPKKKFGYVKRLDRNEDVHIGDDSFIGAAPQEGDKVYFKLDKGNNKPHAVELENELVVFLKNNVLKIENLDYDEFCDNARAYAERLKNFKVTTSMIRKVYSKIMKAESPRELKMLRPQFAYTAGRNDNDCLKEFMDILDHLAKKMSTKDELNNFKDFMEAIVAYRKYVGGDK